ncbi:MAG: TetR/AcrR family transcriptional regulator [Gammaproteobacteria bacterium]|nr:TetR/AcrR family transcriptional regulator [Gammaproteobacteria bacterium]
MGESRKNREFKLREQEILTTATELFSEYGLDNVTVADIAKTTDIGKGTIYKHFVSKEAILVRLANDFSENTLKTIQQLDQSQSCQGQMRQMFEICFNAHIDQPLISEISRRYHQASFFERLPEESKQQCLAIENEYMAVLSGIFEKGFANNELPDAPMDELLIGAHATYTGALEMLHSKQFHCFSEAPMVSQQRFIEIIINYTMTGIFGRNIDGLNAQLGAENE